MIEDAAESSTEETSQPKESDRPKRPTRTVGGMAVLFLATILGGLLIAGPFEAAGLAQFENPSDPRNAGLILVEILVFTGIFLVAMRYDRGEQVIRLLVVGAFALMFTYPLRVFFAGDLGTVIAILGGLVGAVLLWVHPEWYVLDAAGVLGGAVIVGLFGVSLSVLPALLLLVTLAIYDAYSVYISEHMQSLAGGVIGLQLPMVFVVPDTLSFSLRDADDMESAAQHAMFLGVGDAAIPGLLVVSANTFIDAPGILAGINAPAIGALIGAGLGLVALFVLVFRIRRTHAGLPALNGFVILGYLAGTVVAQVPLGVALGIGGLI